MRRPRQGATRGCRPGTYSNEREVAFRIDSDLIGCIELGAGADSVVKAWNARAGERGCLAALQVDLPNAVVESVLRCTYIGRDGHA